MKMKRLFLLSVLVVLVFAVIGCNNSLTGDGTPSSGESRLDGTSWKLSMVTISENYQPFDTIDYSKRNIIYEFQGNNKLVITGKTDSLFIFYHFQEGEHFYRYEELYGCPTCLPGPNLLMDNPKNGHLHYNCGYYANLENDTLRIGRQEAIGMEIDETGLWNGSVNYSDYRWSQYLIKSK